MAEFRAVPQLPELEFRRRAVHLRRIQPLRGLAHSLASEFASAVRSAAATPVRVARYRGIGGESASHGSWPAFSVRRRMIFPGDNLLMRAKVREVSTIRARRVAPRGHKMARVSRRISPFWRRPGSGPAAGPPAPACCGCRPGSVSHACGSNRITVEPMLKRPISANRSSVMPLPAPIVATGSRGVGRNLQPAPHRGHPETSMAPTITTTNGPCSPSKWQTSRSLRANRRGNRCDRERRDAEDAAGHVQGFLQRAVQRHVHAVVIARRQVDGDEAAVAVRSARLVVAEQFGGGVVVALGLEDAAVFDRVRTG